MRLVQGVGVKRVGVTVLVFLVVLCTAGTGEESGPGGGRTETLSDVTRRVVRLKNDLGKTADPEVRLQKFRQLLATYLEEARLNQLEGRAYRAYQVLLEAEVWEMMALSAGMKEPVVAPELARYRARLLYTDGESLLKILVSKYVPLAQKYALLDLLKKTVHRESGLKAWPPPGVAPRRELTPALKAELEEIRRKKAALEEQVRRQKGEKREETVRSLLGMYLWEADLFVEAKMPVQAYKVLLEALARQSQEGIPGGERAPVDYDLCLFLQRLLANGGGLLTVLHAPEVPRGNKDSILLELREAVSVGGLPPLGWTYPRRRPSP